jgi:hypothetical protein
MPLHGGVSLYKLHLDGNQYKGNRGGITSVQIGCDYNHLDDEHYSFIKTKEDANSIFYDAEKLYDYLNYSDEQAALLKHFNDVVNKVVW